MIDLDWIRHLYFAGGVAVGALISILVYRLRLRPKIRPTCVNLGFRLDGEDKNHILELYYYLDSLEVKFDGQEIYARKKGLYDTEVKNRRERGPGQD